MKTDECDKYELHEEDGVGVLKNKIDDTIICKKDKLLEICWRCEEQLVEDCLKVTKFYRKLIK